ncbi:hypothetical protein DL96DRAFT_1816269 [Flagelloscypha sp. PMI_526]|nr:hypothetical protein DL96DRAFT_1816269 [Flagelloscypha sp. PMI_526]
MPYFTKALVSHPQIQPLLAQLEQFLLPRPPIYVLVVVGVLLYLVLVRLLRHRRRDALDRHFSSILRREQREMTPEEAQRIINPVFAYEMPTLMGYSLAFALFKTYGIPTISRLLEKTGELGTEGGVGRRHIDTGLIISTSVICPLQGAFLEERSPSLVIPPVSEPETSNRDEDNMIYHVKDPRSNIAIARMNWIHSNYKINNDDMIYTLSLFIIEPIRWTEKYGWRSLTPLEQEATFVLWKDIGNRMGISDIPATLQALILWSEDYEARAMIPARSNHAVANQTAAELIRNMGPLKGFCQRVVHALLEPRVRIAIGYHAQPWWVHALLQSLLLGQKYFLRHFSLPRVKPNVFSDINTPWRGPDTRLHPSQYTNKPWYKAESTGLLNPFYWVDRFWVAIGQHCEMPSEKFGSKGYSLPEVGPTRLVNLGHKETLEGADQLLRFGCPMKKTQ